MRRPLVVLIVLAAMTTACAGPYDPSTASFHNVNPTLVNIEIKHDNVNGLGAGCAIGIGVTGVGAVVTALNPVAGFTAWVVWGSTAVGATYSLAECWNEYNSNKDWFEVWTKCPGQPYLSTSMSDLGQVAALVNIPSCVCSLACISGVFDRTLHPDPNYYLPGLVLASQQWDLGRHYYHDGANHTNGPATEDPPPPDYDAMAASMGMAYVGCYGLDATGHYC